MDRLKATDSVPFANRDIAPVGGTPQYATDGVPGSVAPTIWPAYAWNMVQDELMALVQEAAITPNDTIWTQVLQGILKSGTFSDTGSANAMVITPPVALPAVASLSDGTRLRIFANATNTGATTLTIGGGAATPIRFPASSLALPAGVIQAGYPHDLMKFGGGTPVWWLMSSGAGSLDQLRHNGISYTTAGVYTFTVPDGVFKIHVRIWGAGGAGGGANSGGQGAGGGGGEYREGWFNVAPNTGITVTVGAGGAALAGNPGGNGAFSVVGSLISGAGGVGGGAGIGGASGSFGAGGSTGVGGHFAQTGDIGGIQFAVTGGNIMAQGGPSFGGNWHMGFVATGGASAGATCSGAGGGGGGGVSAGGSVAGGNGNPGAVIIEW